MNKKPLTRVIVSDMDDVLVRQTVPWLLQGILKSDPIAKIVNDAHLADPTMAEVPAIEFITKKIDTRPDFELSTAFNLSEKLAEELFEIYSVDNTFYDNLPPTAMAMAIRAGLANRTVEELHIVTHCVGPANGNVVSKRKWVSSIFGEFGDRVILEEVPYTTSKADYIASCCPIADTFIDDSLRNIGDVLCNDTIQLREVLIPMFTFNSTPSLILDKLKTLAVLKSISFQYYHGVN